VTSLVGLGERFIKEANPVRNRGLHHHPCPHLEEIEIYMVKLTRKKESSMSVRWVIEIYIWWGIVNQELDCEGAKMRN
jgi:hypothetical protein